MALWKEKRNVVSNEGSKKEDIKEAKEGGKVISRKEGRKEGRKTASRKEGRKKERRWYQGRQERKMVI